jgi:hypothetical protein
MAPPPENHFVRDPIIRRFSAATTPESICKAETALSFGILSAPP